MIVQPQSEILEVGLHNHQWARSVGAGGLGIEECVVCHTRRPSVRMTSGIGGFAALAAPSLPGANPKAEEKLAKGLRGERDEDEPQMLTAGPRTVTDTLTGLPPESYHSAEPPENEDEVPTVAQLTGFAITPTTQRDEEGNVIDPRPKSKGGQGTPEERAQDQGSNPSDDDLRGMRKNQLVAYARERGLDIDENLYREQLAEDIIARRPR